MFKDGKNFFSRYLSRRELERKVLHGSRRRRTEDSELATAADHSVVLGCFMLVLVWGICLLLLALSGSHRQVAEKLVLGQIAPRNVNVAFDFVFEDREATTRTRNEAGREATLYFQLSGDRNSRIRQTIRQFFAAAQTRKNPAAAPQAHDIHSELMLQLAAKLDESTLGAVNECFENPASYRYFEEQLDALLGAGILGSKARHDDWTDRLVRIVDLLQRKRLPQKLSSLPDETEAGKILAAALLHSQVRSVDFDRIFMKLSSIFREQIGSAGNLNPDEKRTLAAREQAIENIAPVTREIRKHHPLIVKGEVVTEETLELLRTYTDLASRQTNKLEDWGRNIDSIFWSIALVVMSGFYLYHIHPEVVRSNRKIAMVGSVAVISLLFNYAGIEFFYFILSESKKLSPPMVTNAVPIALAAVLIATFLGLRAAIGAGFFVVSITAMMLDLSFDFALKGVVVCAVVALVVRNATDYRSFFMRIVLSVTPLTWLLNANLLSGAGDIRSVADIALHTGVLALGNGLVTAFVALVLIFVYELLLNVNTNMSLLVLCDYNHPLLERLKREAPGTFFHSLMVATLAEDAARAIGANPLKAKAGALFHDIGKLFKPEYFTENNQDTGNHHAGLTPHMSSIIIRDHVKEGLELARRHKLGRVVRDMIEQHHGNDLVAYFYGKALEQCEENGESVPEAEFRYHGLPPRTREAAIVSLADACEAASRSLVHPSSSRLEALVNDLFLKRFQDGQLAGADMTLAELQKVKESFINTLLSMKHGRITYNLHRNCHGNKPDLPLARKTKNPSEPPRS